MQHKERSNYRICKRFIYIVLIVMVLAQPTWAAGTEVGRQLTLDFDGAAGTEISVFPTPDGKGEGISAEGGSLVLDDVRAGDVFSYRVAAPGCYTITTTFTVDSWDLMRESKRITVEHPRLAGSGYEPAQLHSWGDVVEDALFDERNLRNVDLGILDTPAFSRTKAENAFTTISEGTAYLRKVEEQSDKAHLFFLDDGGIWPVMLLTNTDLSGAVSLEKALSLLAKDGKLKVLYQAQIHGNEPAGGEGALTVARSLSKDKEGYLNDTDVVIVPYVNRYGAEQFTRAGNAGGLNLNRDSLALRSDSTKRMHWLFNELMPEIFVDGHEFSSIPASIGQSDEGYYFKWQDDIQVNCVNNLNRDTSLFDGELNIVKNTLATLRDKGFRTFQYKPSCNNTTSCNYARLRNAYSFLVESNGIGLGKNHFERRVLSQHEAVTAILRQVAADSQAIRQKVAAARSRVVEKGRRYSDDDEFVLRHGYSEQRGFSIPRPSFDFNGRYFGSPYRTEMCNNADYVRRSRTRPTAYIIPKDTPGVQKVKTTLAANGAKCFELTEQAAVSVRQYRGTVSRAVLGEKKKVTFKDGAYVFYMDQEAANVIAASMEPDVNDTAGFDGSFVQSGVLQKSAGGYPIYRFEKKDPQQNLKLKIKKHPKAVKAKGASSAKFSVSASGKNLTYKWYYKTAKGKTWKRCKETSASKSALRIKSAAKKKGYAYRCVVSNGSMEVTSREAKIKK